MEDLHIRPARATDSRVIAHLLDQLGYPTQESEVAGRRERLSAHPGTHVLLAERAGAVVGLATVHVMPVLNRRRDVAWLTALVVDASARGQGVGRALVRAVEAHARDAGCERLSVTTHTDRTEAQEFYARVGLERTGLRFGKSLEP